MIVKCLVREFIYVLEDVTKGKCPVVYYCLGHKLMRDWLRPLKNDDDYRRFLDASHGNEGKIIVYIDHYNDSVLDWIEEEKEEEGVDSESSDEDKDSVMSDALSVDHEPDEEHIQAYALFEGIMKEIRVIDIQAYDHLMERDPKSWSRAFLSCDAIENGICESFNVAIVHARKKPIITMLEEIRRFVMDRMYCKRLKGQKWNLAIYPSIRKKIVDKRKHLRYWYGIPSGVQQFEVRSVHEVYAIDIPCVHVMAAISYLNENVEDYVATWFTTEMFGNCYKYKINPLNGSEMWPSWEGQPMLPPKRRRLLGRPKVNRKKVALEKEGRHTISKKGAITKCSICREPGHNKIRCPLSKEAKKKKGKHVPDVEDESEFEIEEMAEVEDEYESESESEIEELAEDVDEPEQGQVDEQVVEAVVEVVVEPDQEQVHEPVVDPELEQIVVEPVIEDVDEPAAQPVVEVEQVAQPLKRKRKYSERITEVTLRRVVITNDGCGLSVNKLVTLE
uniref:Zinc finger PMZ-type domain-containing protein n=1 Tax=Lactuca sativa TaxID=4236 RepID=A0A9R1VCV2_LACSA|nr:hypothetical protein LSAT_V11C500295570 [Lactuca sativa]